MEIFGFIIWRRKDAAELIRTLDLLALGADWRDTKLQERFNTRHINLMHGLGIEPFEAEHRQYREEEETPDYDAMDVDRDEVKEEN